MAKPIALAADHGGFELKEAVKAHLKELGLEYIDFGTHSTDSVDQFLCHLIAIGFELRVKNENTLIRISRITR